VFQMDVAKVDRDIAYVVIVIHVCCKRLFKCFICVFGCMLQMFLSGYCIYFTHMLQVFYMDVAYAYNGFQAFSGVFCKCSKSMFKVFYLSSDVCVSVASGCFKSRFSVAHRIHVGSGRGRVRSPHAVPVAWALYGHAARETQAQAKACWREHGAWSVGTRAGNGVPRGRPPNVRGASTANKVRICLYLLLLKIS
jgi:hypothetical protein